MSSPKSALSVTSLATKYSKCPLDELSFAPAKEAENKASGKPDSDPTHESEVRSATEFIAAKTMIREYGEENDENEEKEVIGCNAKAVGAGLLSCAVTSLWIGPVAGTLMGCGSMVAAAKSPSGTVLGDTARAVGEVSIMIRDKAVELNATHGIASCTKKAAVDLTACTCRAASSTGEKMKEAEKNHQVTKRSMKALQDAGRRVKELEREHQVTERAAGGVSSGLSFLAQKIQQGFGNRSRGETEGGISDDVAVTVAEEETNFEAVAEV